MAPRRGPDLPYSVVAGVTPWGRRWVVASAKLTGSVFAPEPPKVYDTFLEVLSEHPAFAAIVVNSPVGYLDSSEKSLRHCDLAAKRLLGRRGSTVRRAPSRATLVDHQDAQADHLDAVTSMKIPVMMEVASEMSPYRQRQVFEGHPELSFYLLNQEVPLRFSKLKEVGRDERRDILAEKIRGIEKVTDAQIAPRHHLLDAAALLFSARRVFLHAAKRLPEDAQWDSEGLRMEIVY